MNLSVDRILALLLPITVVSANSAALPASVSSLGLTASLAVSTLLAIALAGNCGFQRPIQMIVVVIAGIAPALAQGGVETNLLVGDIARYVFHFAVLGAAVVYSRRQLVASRLLRISTAASLTFASCATVLSLAARRSWYSDDVRSALSIEIGLVSTFTVLALTHIVLFGIDTERHVTRFVMLSAALSMTVIAGTRALTVGILVIGTGAALGPVRRAGRGTSAVVAALLLGALAWASPLQPHIHRSVSRLTPAELAGDQSAASRSEQSELVWELALRWPAESLAGQRATVGVAGTSETRAASQLDTPLTSLAKLGLIAGTAVLLATVGLAARAANSLAHGRTLLLALVPLSATAAVVENRGFSLALIAIAVFASKPTPSSDGSQLQPRHSQVRVSAGQ